MRTVKQLKRKPETAESKSQLLSSIITVGREELLLSQTLFILLVFSDNAGLEVATFFHIHKLTKLKYAYTLIFGNMLYHTLFFENRNKF